MVLKVGDSVMVYKYVYTHTNSATALKVGDLIKILESLNEGLPVYILDGNNEKRPVYYLAQDQTGILICDF